MNFTTEQIAKARQAKSVEELLAIAKENGFELTEEQASEYFAELHKEGELSDEELDSVAGGGKDSTDTPAEPTPPPQPASAQVTVTVDSSNPTCPLCGSPLNKYDKKYFSDEYGAYEVFTCGHCGQAYRRHWNGDLWTTSQYFAR